MNVEEAAQKSKEIYDKAKKEVVPESAGAITAICAFVPYVGPGVSLLKALMPGQPQLTLEDVLNRVQQGLNEIKQQIADLGLLLKQLARLQDDQELLRDIEDIMSHVRATLNSAKDWASKPEDYTEAVLLGSIPEMNAAMNKFLDDTYFMRIYVEEFLYKYVTTDEWSTQGQQYVFSAVMKPNDCPEGEVGKIWDYGWMLPAFLEAVSCRLIVLQILWPEDYHTRFRGRAVIREEIENYARRLWTIHNKICENIKEIPPPRSGKYRPYQPEHIWKHHLFGIDNRQTPCGAVECYSATASIVDEQYVNTLWATPWDPEPKPPGDEEPEESWSQYYEQWSSWYERFLIRWRIKAYQQRVDVYRKVALPSIWDAVNSLRTMIEKPCLELSEYASEEGFNELKGFSIRKVMTFIPESIRGVREPGRPMSLREMEAIIKSPNSTQLISLRRMFMLDN